MANPIVASERVQSLLSSLHDASLSQEQSETLTTYWREKFSSPDSGVGWNKSDDDMMRDKFIALEPDKCQFVYLLARACGATHIVEAGTSFGVSTIYLALAAGQNVKAKAKGEPGKGGRVFGTEQEPEKAEKAREHWRRAGEEVEPWITLLEGDLRETVPRELRKENVSVDLVLIDIWAPMALPSLKAAQPFLRQGALVIADNTKKGEKRFADFLRYIHDPKNGFRTMTTPFAGGLEVAVYLPDSLEK